MVGCPDVTVMVSVPLGLGAPQSISLHRRPYADGRVLIGHEGGHYSPLQKLVPWDAVSGQVLNFVLICMIRATGSIITTAKWVSLRRPRVTAPTPSFHAARVWRSHGDRQSPYGPLTCRYFAC